MLAKKTTQVCKISGTNNLTLPGNSLISTQLSAHLQFDFCLYIASLETRLWAQVVPWVPEQLAEVAKYWNEIIYEITALFKSLVF